MNTDENNLSSMILFEQNSHLINEHSKLTDEQLKKYETWKIQPGMAQIKLEYIDFDHEVRLNVEHLNETDRKLVDETTNINEPKKKKFKGQNKKHLEINARSANSSNDHHLCFFVVRGDFDKCPYQNNCKHSHDLTSYLSHRPIDLSSNCYMFDTHGRCFFGILCRYGQSHIDPITGNNQIKSNWNYKESLNKYPPLLKHLLRRKKYDYTLADRLVKIANKQITKANVVKRNIDEEKINDDQKNCEEKDDRSLVNIYYSNLPINQDEVCRKCSNA